MSATLSRLLANKKTRWTIAGGAAVLGIALLYVAFDSGSNAFATLLVEMSVKTGLVIGLLLVALFWLKRWQVGGGRRVRQVALVESLRLTPKQVLHLVRVGDRTLLIGAVDAQLTLLTEVAAQAEVEPSAPAPAPNTPFAAYMAQWTAQEAEAKLK